MEFLSQNKWISFFRVSNEFIFIKLLLAAIYLILEWYFKNFIAPQFFYMGYEYTFVLWKYLVTKGLFLVLLFLALDMYNRNRFLYSIYILLIFFFYLPNAILYSFMNIPSGPFYSSFAFVSFFFTTTYIKIPEIALRKISNVYLVLAILLVAVMIPIIIRFGLNINLQTLLLREIYETRDVFSKLATGFVNYLYNWQAKTIIPVAIVFFMLKKQRAFALLSVFALMYLFLISGNKIVYFTTIILIFFYFIGKTYTAKVKFILLMLLIALSLFHVLDKYILHSILLEGVFVNRFIFFPALLNHYYFDFFAGKPLYFAETHIFNFFVESPYKIQTGFLISQIYFKTNDMFANNGIISDGFANLGYLGVGIFTVIFALLFILFNSFNIDKRYFGIYFSYIYIILSAPFLTCLITGGIVLFIILAIVFFRERTKS